MQSLQRLKEKYIPGARNVWEFIKRDAPLAFAGSLALTIGYLLFLPVLRGISNLKPAQSGQCLGQSVSPIGVLLFAPVVRTELGAEIRELIVSRPWSYRKTTTIRLICSLLLTTGTIALSSLLMQKNNCRFPLWEFTAAAALYATFLGLLELTAACAAKTMVTGCLAAIGYCSLERLQVLQESSILYLFPVVSGELRFEKLLFLILTDTALALILHIQIGRSTCF